MSRLGERAVGEEIAVDSDDQKLCPLVLNLGFNVGNLDVSLPSGPGKYN